jgi:D-alanyl-D-alanine carboxypeptidase (penicillin-binding protein 5/6)
MRTGLRHVLAVALAAGATAVTCGFAPLAAASGDGPPVGGPLLAAKGLVVQPLPGAPALPARSQLPASSWLVADLTTGQVLAAKDPHGRFLPASTLKTLTAVTLIPKLRTSESVEASNHDARIDGSRVGLVPGMHYTVKKLFTAMLVVSANDAAEALAHAAGGVTATLAAMNAEAHHLQADDTVAMTPSGLDGSGESSSAYDLALIAQAGLQIPAFRHYIATVHTSMPAPHHKHFAIYTHNQLLTTYRGDIGVKNGYTDAAMGTYVGAATRHGHTILVSLMHANPDFWPMARSLLSWGFKADGRVSPVGTLVKPLTPAVTPAAAQGAATAVQAASVSRHGHKSSPLELVLVAVTVVVATMTGVRRLRRAQRRPKLKLPRTY